METKNKNNNQNHYLKESAGKLMVKNMPTVAESSTVEDVENLLSEKANEFESINYIYILDKNQKLTGVISIKELFRSPKKKRVKNLSPNKIISARAHTDQEKVVLLALKHNLKQVPVIDKNGFFLGAVSSDTILKILNAENIEDVLRSSGTIKMENAAVNIIQAGAWLHFRKRLPWLILGLAGGILAAFVVDFFEVALKKQIMLAAFIPAIVYIADAVGSQTQTIFIRSLALDENLNLKKYIFREVRVNFSLSIVLGIIAALFSFIWLKSQALSLVLGVSIMLTILTATAVALILPKILQKLRFDPAIASGPFATVLRDISSLLIYFIIASLIL